MKIRDKGLNSALLPIILITPVHRPVEDAVPIPLITEKVVKGLVSNEVGVEIHNDLFVLDVGWLTPIISVTHSIDIQALTGNILDILQADMVFKDKTLDALRFRSESVKLVKPSGHRLKEVLLVIVLPEFFELLVHIFLFLIT